MDSGCSEPAPASAAKDFVYLILLITWMDTRKFVCKSPLNLVEIFSGKGRISKMAAWLGLEVRAVDITYCRPWRKRSKWNKRRQRSPMDLCGEAGFTFHGLAL